MPLRDWNGVARYGVPGLLLGLVLTGGFGGGRGPVVRAENLPGLERPRMAAAATGDATGTIAFTTNHGGTAQLLYLVDTRTHAFAIYRVDPTNPGGTIKLEASRQYQWDLKLTEYNNQKPEVAAIESMIKTLGHPAR